jgi:hypothetical protein
MGKKGPKSKVARLIETYELDGIGETLVDGWTRDEDRHSLRELADYFNRRLLRSALEDEQVDSLDGEVENYYRLLTNEATTSGVRSETRDRLEQRGVDVDALERDFVSYQAIRTYLKNYQDASPPESTTTPDEQRSKKADTVQRLKNRLRKVTEQALADLKKAGHVTLGDFDVVVTVRVHCADCNTQHPVSEIISTGSCDCAERSN